MPFHELPPEVLDMLAKYAAPPSLVAHLTVVHDAAVALIKHIDASCIAQSEKCSPARGI